jgi:hypothetical protein
VNIDDDASGFGVDQNVLWNNGRFNVFVHGKNYPEPNNNNVHNNTIPDVGITFPKYGPDYSYIDLNDIPNCGTTQVVDNRVLVPVNTTLFQTHPYPPCKLVNNNSTAPGATEMNDAVHVGCNFAGCASAGPPAIVDGLVAPSIAIQPNDVTVAAGQTATFTVAAGGSPALFYQWLRNGTNIAGATDWTYTTMTNSASDNGAVFTVKVSNSVGSAVSNGATLTVTAPD